MDVHRRWRLHSKNLGSKVLLIMLYLLHNRINKISIEYLMILIIVILFFYQYLTSYFIDIMNTIVEMNGLMDVRVVGKR